MINGHGDDLKHSMGRHSTHKSSLEGHDQTQPHKTKVSPKRDQKDCSYSTYHQMMPSMVNMEADALVGKSGYHSHNESMSSVISSIGIMSKFEDNTCLVGDTTYPACSPFNKELSSSPWCGQNQLFGSENGHEKNVTGKFLLRSSNLDDLTTSHHVQKLTDGLKSESPELQTAAASELRLLAKHNMENRVLIGKFGVIPPLVSLLHSMVKKVQENAVTALLNLSINDDNKVLIAEAGAVGALLHVLDSGTTEAKENSAAALFTLSSLEEYKAKIGRSGAAKALVYLLGSGSLRGRKDAAAALFNLSIFHENKVRIVQAGAVKYLVELVDPSSGMVDKSVALLANISTIPEGRLAIVQERGIPPLVDIVETGSARGTENAASTEILQSSTARRCRATSHCACSIWNTQGEGKHAQQILSHLRSQHEGIGRKAKS